MNNTENTKTASASDWSELAGYIQDAKTCLHALGEAWRGDWSFFDGRSLRIQLNDIQSVLDGDMTPNDFMEKNDITTDPKYPNIFIWKD